VVNPSLVIIISLFLGAVVAMFVLPLAVTAWSIRRTGRRLLTEVTAFLGDDQEVLRVATGRAKRPAWQTATAVGLLVVGLGLGPPAGVVAIVAAIVLWCVWFRPRLIATTPTHVVMLTSTWKHEPLSLIARIDRTQWAPRRSFGTLSQAIGGEVVVIETFGQRAMVPTG
jgi:hypothetical protein